MPLALTLFLQWFIPGKRILQLFRKVEERVYSFFKSPIAWKVVEKAN
ncbi:hypothetical protein HMPREF0758_3330 [Serratia odorifera DSM 4582]|uniref:Uncharacterized protein n=1 Tax=Serratia odorifera DSM 4582 TaxID=667129 RepID=D4E580_SEROD|nr:hypothetical protein HMPREF0758_3330 [Serratia odorifera DSM 4582]